MANPKRHPRTGEKREKNLPLKIDKLPPPATEAILVLRNQRNKTWDEIENLSAAAYDKNWEKRENVWKAQGGFIDWENLDGSAKRLFPKRRLASTSLQRWFDLRVVQVRREVMQRSAIARELAESFASSAVAGADDAVINAARDQLMSLLSEDLTPETRSRVSSQLIMLADILQTARANAIKERKVAADERKLKLVEEREAIQRRKLEAEAERLTKKQKRGELKPEDLADLVQRTFGIAPKREEGKK